MIHLILLLIVSDPALADFPETVANRDEVAVVRVVPARMERQRRIVHLCNWHMVPRELIATAMKADGNTEAEVDEFYARHLDEVEPVQAEQRSLIPFLVSELSLKAAHIEGLMPDEVDLFKKRAVMVKQAKVTDSDDPLDRLFADIVRRDKLMIGIAGQMHADGNLEILAAEDQKAFEAANPVGGDGTVEVNDGKNESRENAVVQNMLKSGPISFIVLGTAHNLADNVPDDCEYVRIETKRVAELMEAHHE